MTIATLASRQQQRGSAILLHLLIFNLDKQALFPHGSGAATTAMLKTATALVGVLLASQSALAQQTVLGKDLPRQMAVCMGKSVGDAQSDNPLSDCLVPQAQTVAAQSDNNQATQPVVTGRLLKQDSKRKRNRSAADLQPSWNDLTPLSTATGFASLTTDQDQTRKNVFSRLRAAHADTEGAKTPLHNIPINSITVLGERDGITYGAWKSGPAGTMPIRNYYKSGHIAPGSGLSRKFKALLRRATKTWSKRLVDDGRRYDITLDDGTKVKDVHGIVIQTKLQGGNESWAGIIDFDLRENGNIYRPYNGRMRIGFRGEEDLDSGQTRTVAHEIGHILGIGTSGISNLSKYYNYEDHTWSGPNAMRENGGKPVSLQWTDVDTWWVVKEPHAPGARRDKAHLGVCKSLMAYCHDGVSGASPSEIDFAFLVDLGFTLVDADVAAKPERYGHLSWGKWAVWGASVERDLQNNLYENPHDFVQAHATAFGAAPAMTLTNNSALSGSAVWKGSLVGVDLGRSRLPPVVGKAKLSVNLDTLSGKARFSDLTAHFRGNNVLDSGVTKPFRKSQLSYAIDVIGNDFTDANNRVTGSFYGPSHEEMAGVLNDTRAGVKLLAGFGGIQTNE